MNESKTTCICRICGDKYEVPDHIIPIELRDHYEQQVKDFIFKHILKCSGQFDVVRVDPDKVSRSVQFLVS
jgi:hypothetical protein